MSTDKEIEQAIKAAGADVAPRITPADIDANIASEHYFTAAEGDYGAKYEAVLGRGGVITSADAAPPAPPLSLLTFCVLILKNNYTVTGESACVSPENFDADVGRKVARANAVAKMWPLLGFRLRDRLSAVVAQQPKAPPTPGLALDSGEFIPAANIPHHPV